MTALRITVNISTLKANLAALKSLTRAKICAVVKADAYGHGLGAMEAFSCADEFAVSSIGEALELREITDKPVNILSSPDITAECMYSSGIFPSVSTESDMEFAAARKATAINIKLNSGMNRYGAECENLDKMLKAADYHKLKVKSVFSHIYDISAAQMQYELFMKYVQPLSDYIPQKHLLSSNFAVLPDYMHLDMVRPGYVLYGYGHELVKSAITAKCGVTQVREVSENENIGYGICKSGKKRTVAVLSAGYADGCGRIIDNMPRYAEINGSMCAVVGQICMDAMMADVSGLRVKVGDEATILGDCYGCESIANSCGTIGYEILTGFSRRVRREYINR